MKVVILAGGFGTRISEESGVRPKPMVEIGGRPILWHIMKIYAHHGFNDFVICCGYRAEYIRRYFLDYFSNSSDFRIDLKTNQVEWMNSRVEDWRVTLLDTGLNTMTGGRIRQARRMIGDEAFCLTYGDGVADVNIRELVDFHNKSGLWATVTAVSQPGRFGALALNAGGDQVTGFREKGTRDGGLINGGFFVCEPQVFDLIDDDLTVWEQEPMSRLVELGKLASYHHGGFWQAMDTMRDRAVLEQLWADGAPPWRVWQ